MAELGRTPIKQALARAVEGMEGARLIGASIAGLAGSNVQNVLESLKTLVDSKLDANDASVTNTRTPTDGTVTNAKVASNAAIAESKLSLASDAAAATASRRTLGTGAQQAAAGNDSRLSDTRTPTDSTVTPQKFHSTAIDPTAATAGARTLGTGPQQAAAGNDGRLSDTRTPTDGTVTPAKFHADAKDPAAATAGARTLGTGAQQAAAGNDSRLSDARTPLAHNHTHLGWLPFAFSGVASPRSSNPVRLMGAQVIRRVAITCSVAPGTSNLTYEVRIAGAAVAGGSLSLTAGQTDAVSASLDVAVADLSKMTVAITNAGGTAAEGVTVSVELSKQVS